MSLRGRHVAEINEADLQDLITDRVRESQTLEYKRDSYGRNDEQVREMLRDISAMANAFGGDLLIGVDEDAEGVAIELLGIENAEEEAQRMVSSCLSNLEDRIPGLVGWPVPLSNGRHVILVRIQRSLRAPHMVTFRGLNQFWVRHDRQKSPMSIHEIKEACLKVEGLMEKLDRFLERRKGEIRADIRTSPYYIISVTPIFVDTEVLDIRDQELRGLLANPPGQRVSGWNVSFDEAPRPSLHGLRLETRNRTSLELFRNGYLDLRVRIGDSFFYDHRVRRDERERQVFNAYAIVEYPVSLIRLAKAIYNHIGLTDLVVVSISLYNIAGFALMPEAPKNIQRYLGLWDRLAAVWESNHLEILPRQAPSLDYPDRIAKESVDRIWQAFGFEQAPLFDAEDNFTP